MEEANEIILYQPDETLKIDVRDIILHIRNIFKEGELNENSVCKESLQTAADGKRYRISARNYLPSQRWKF